MSEVVSNSNNTHLIAQDIARHYLSSLNPYEPHAKNVINYLQKPVEAITRKILVPAPCPTTSSPIVVASVSSTTKDAASLEDATITGTGTNTATVNATTGGEELDWRDYLSKSTLDSEDHNPLDDTESDDLDGNIDLSERSIARRDAFLSIVQMACANNPILPQLGSTSSLKSNPPNNNNNNNANRRPFLSNIKKSLKAISPTKTKTISQDDDDLQEDELSNEDYLSSRNDGNLLSTALSGFSVSERDETSTTNRSSNSLATFPRSTKNKLPNKYPQIHFDDLTVRLDLYIRSLRRVMSSRQHIRQHPDQQHNHDGECVIHLERVTILQTRIQILLNSFLSTVGTINKMHTILTNLLTYFTKEALAVPTISDELQQTIRRIVMEYDHLTSFASLAFLSTPEDGAEMHLLPLLTKFVDFVRREWKNLTRGCKIEEMLSECVHPKIRTMFKTMEFRSIGHLLEVCRSHEKYLKDIRIVRPFYDDDDSPTSFLTSFQSSTSHSAADTKRHSKMIKQALKDLRRETITVNGHVLPPTNSLRELVKLLRETLNSRPMKLKERKVGRRRTTSSSTSSSNSKKAAKNDLTTLDQSELSDYSNNTTSSSSDAGFISSEYEADTDGSIPRKGSGQTLQHLMEQEESIEKQQESSGGRLAKRRHFNVDAIDLMTQRLLMAASRTGTAGDAYFVVRDLFGGSEVEVVPSNRTSIANPYDRFGRMDTEATNRGGGTIELVVRLASIVIKCHAKFDVYPQPLTGECEPLIELHTTTTETIELQEVRASDDMTMGGTKDDGAGDTMPHQPTVLMLQEKKTENTGFRTLSIQPAKYEKVNMWHTPS